MIILDSTMNSIECDYLSKNFGPLVALREVTLRVKRGEICAVIGPNGSGKTTLLKILATLIIPSHGVARVCGEDITNVPHRVRARIGFVSSEDRSFYWRLTGKQNLKFFAALHNINGPDRERRIDHLLDTVGFDGFAGRKFSEYSTGMKQALSIVRGFLHDPQVFLLDEPTRSLSPEVANRFYELIRDEAKKGETCLIASHNLREVERIADQIAILHKGLLKAKGTITDLNLQAGLTEDKSLDLTFSHFTEDGQG